MLSTCVKKKNECGIYKKKLTNEKNSSDILRLYYNSNNGLIYPYTFLYIIITLTYRKIYFYLYTIGKKNVFWKIRQFSGFTTQLRTSGLSKFNK